MVTDTHSYNYTFEKFSYHRAEPQVQRYKRHRR